MVAVLVGRRYALWAYASHVDPATPRGVAEGTHPMTTDTPTSFFRTLLHHTLWVALLTLGLTLVGLAGCDGDGEPGSLVVGVTSDFQDLAELEVTMTVDGEVLRDDRARVGSGGITFPAELAFNDVTEGQTLAVMLAGYDSSGAEVVVRSMQTTAVAGDPRLVRVHLDAQCRLPDAGGSGPSCDDPSQTCIDGACTSPTVESGAQEPYQSDWAGGTSDICKEAGGGEPEVHVGAGQSDYFAVDDYEPAQIEAGPQGGHHIWVAARIKNLTQSGSITEVGAEIPALGLSMTPLKVIFTFDPDEGGYCKIFGLRLQLDIDGDDIMTMLGQDVKVTMTVSDKDGDVGTGDKWFTLSDSIL